MGLRGKKRKQTSLELFPLQSGDWVRNNYFHLGSGKCHFVKITLLFARKRSTLLCLWFRNVSLQFFEIMYFPISPFHWTAQKHHTPLLISGQESRGFFPVSTFLPSPPCKYIKIPQIRQIHQVLKAKKNPTHHPTKPTHIIHFIEHILVERKAIYSHFQMLGVKYTPKSFGFFLNSLEDTSTLNSEKLKYLWCLPWQSALCFWNDLHTKFDLMNYSVFQIKQTFADFFAIWRWNSLDKLFPVNCSLHPHWVVLHLRLVETFYSEIRVLLLLSKNNRGRLWIS